MEKVRVVRKQQKNKEKVVVGVSTNTETPSVMNMPLVELWSQK